MSGQFQDLMGQTFFQGHLPTALYLKVSHSGNVPRVHISHSQPNRRRRGMLQSCQSAGNPLPNHLENSAEFPLYTCIQNIKTLNALLHMPSASTNNYKINVEYDDAEYQRVICTTCMSAFRRR